MTSCEYCLVRPERVCDNFLSIKSFDHNFIHSALHNYHSILGCSHITPEHVECIDKCTFIEGVDGFVIWCLISIPKRRFYNYMVSKFNIFREERRKSLTKFSKLFPSKLTRGWRCDFCQNHA